MKRSCYKTTLLLLVLVLLALGGAATQALALSGGNVLPANARPHGYSLTDMAAATAQFNTGTRAPDTLPHTPFQILYSPNSGPFVVRPGTMLYVPLFYSDDSPPILGVFPNVHDQTAVAKYVFERKQVGIVVADIVVDGVVTSLGRDYAVGVDTAPLPDGGGTHYLDLGAFLTPLSKGTHTVIVRVLATGDALLDLPEFFPDGTLGGEFTYTVIVR